MAAPAPRPARAHIAAALTALVVAVAASAAWLVWYKTFPRGTGFDDLSGLFGALTIFGLSVLWLVLRAIVPVARTALMAVVVAAVLTAIVVVMMCGPVACFVPGPERLLGWFVVVGVAVAALLHHLVLVALSPRTART